MRAFKRISLLALAVYLAAMGLRLADSVVRSDISRDVFLREQLAVVTQRPNDWPVLVYGSSAAALGFSARDFSARTGTPALNMATIEQGGQFDRFISLLSDGTGRGKIIILSDRNYRRADLTALREPSTAERVLAEFSFVPIVRRFFRSRGHRDALGDFDDYPEMVFRVAAADPAPRYTQAHANLMRDQIQSALRGGMCPILVFVPLLVPREHLNAHVLATRALVDRLAGMGLAQHIVTAPLVESDRSLFTDANHGSETGRRKWTQVIATEIAERNLCGIATRRQEGPRP